jgi:hypothetical protein
MFNSIQPWAPLSVLGEIFSKPAEGKSKQKEGKTKPVPSAVLAFSKGCADPAKNFRVASTTRPTVP